MCSTNVVEYDKFTYFVSMLLRCEIFLSKPSLTKVDSLPYKKIVHKCSSGDYGHFSRFHSNV